MAPAEGPGPFFVSVELGAMPAAFRRRGDSARLLDFPRGFRRPRIGKRAEAQAEKVKKAQERAEKLAEKAEEAARKAREAAQKAALASGAPPSTKRTGAAKQAA